ALAAACKRKTLAGLPALAEELETALIPVNRAAGRRALARLAREVRRVTLGVGRNALPSSSDSSPSSRRASLASQPAYASEAARAPSPSAHTFSREEDPTTARGQIPDELLRRATPAPSNELPTMQFDPSSREPSPSQVDVDSLISDFGVSGGADHEHARELKALAGLDPTPPPPSPPPPTERARRRDPASPAPAGAGPPEGSVESLLSLSESERPSAASPAKPASRTAGGGDAASRAPRIPAPATSSSSLPTPALGLRRSKGDAQLPTQPSQLKKARGSLHSAPQAGSRRGSGLWVAVALLAVAAGGLAVWQLRPAPIDARPAIEPLAPGAAALASAARATPACKATLVVTDVPARAEVLLHEGQAPVDVEKMPVGARLEFVATAEGFAPKRVVVPAGATWDPGADGKPRFETAVQLDKSAAKAGANDPWPTAEPGTEVGGQGPPGTIHVVATPRGAEVWMLAGMGPEARVEQLRCDKDVEVLVAGPGPYRKRLRVAGADFAIDAAPPAPGKAAIRIARLSAR
ncbi:MAG TPA: hypothetical protein VH044_16535, partial [Polyangiaceae bacterium]|nr:hypothetical protein [Polyangiaceae bacterium]